MESERSRSEQVIEEFKRRRLAVSALRRIREIIHGFEQDRLIDRRLARFGLVIIMALVLLAALFFFSTESVKLS